MLVHISVPFYTLFKHEHGAHNNNPRINTLMKSQTEDKDEFSEYDFEFPLDVAWYTWIFLIICAVFYAVFALPCLWVMDKTSNIYDRCKYAIAVRRYNSTCR